MRQAYSHPVAPRGGPSARSGLVLLLAIGCLLDAAPVRASCDTIPSATWAFRSARGSVDRPFAGPGQFVELRLDANACGPSEPGLPASPSQLVVTLVFRPPVGDRQVVILAEDCDAVEQRRQGCSAGRPIARAECIPANVPGEPVDLAVVTRDGARRLQVRFPDTDALADTSGDLRTLAGPVAIAVTTAAADLPCALAASDCSELTHDGLVACVDELFVRDGSCHTGAAALDATFGHFTALPHPNDYQALCAYPDPPCTGTAQEVRFAVDASGNLLVPVDWRGILTNEATTPLPRILRGSTAVDAQLEIAGVPITIPGRTFLRSYTFAGARLPPIFEPTIDGSHPAPFELGLLGSADAPETVLRLARRETALACIGGADDGAFCEHASQCESGTCAQRYLQCAGGTYDGLPCAASEDCEGGSCGGGTRCAADASVACARDGDCPSGECGPSLFEFRDRLSGSTNAVIERESTDGGVCQAPQEDEVVQACTDTASCSGALCVKYRMDALNPVPLEGIAGSEELFTFARREPIEGRDLNDDGDATDLVVTVRDRATGERLRFDGQQREGRAVARVMNGLVDFPAIASEGDTFAFLEPEPLECAGGASCDRNGDGDAFDTMLRVYRRIDAGPSATGELANLTAGSEIAVDAAQMVNGRSLAVSGGRVFYRRAETGAVRYRTSRVSVASDGTPANSHSVRSPGGVEAWFPWA